MDVAKMGLIVTPAGGSGYPRLVVAVCGTVVVEYLACAELSYVFEVFRRGGGADFITRRDGELDGVTAYDLCTALDQKRLSR